MIVLVSYEREAINMQSNDMKRITGTQIRAARSALRLTAQELAERSGVGVATIRRAESIDGETAMNLAIERAVVAALEDAGIAFIEENGGGPGVRLKDPLPNPKEKP